MEQIIEYIDIATRLIAIAAAISVVTPNKTDNIYVAKAKAVLDIIALNFGHAKNKG